MDGDYNGSVIDAQTLVYLLGAKEAELFVLKRRVADLEASLAAASPAGPPQDSGAGKTPNA